MQKKINSKLLDLPIAVTLLLLPFYFFRLNFGPIRTNIFEIGIFVSFLITIILANKRRDKLRFGSIWFYLFLLISFAAIFINSDRTEAVGVFKGWFLAPAVLFFVIINTFDKSKLPKYLWALYLPMQIVSLWAIAQKLQLITTLFYQKQSPDFNQYLLLPLRVFGPFDSPNYLAMYLAPIIFVSILLFPYLKSRLTKVFFCLSFLLPLLALYFSGSRAGLLALVVGCFVYLLLFFLKTRHIAVLFLSIIFLLISGIGYYASTTGVSADRAGSNSSRLRIYHYSINLIEKNWFLGVGLGGYPAAIAQETRGDTVFQQNDLSYAVHPHNLFLAMWLNLGLFGLMSFLIILVIFGLKLRQIFKASSWKTALPIGAAMTAIIVHGLFDTTYYKNDLSAIFWLLLGFVYILENKYEHAAETIKN
ncbi:MAG: O-antigen ligase family protein [Candidatus Berkelbacteria bacterium]|nr:O-antigen ligase family protein [Candidatus Berkelbacteria bacterium]